MRLVDKGMHRVEGDWLEEAGGEQEWETGH